VRRRSETTMHGKRRTPRVVAAIIITTYAPDSCACSFVWMLELFSWSWLLTRRIIRDFVGEG
jgi:hypothetical protein